MSIDDRLLEGVFPVLLEANFSEGQAAAIVGAIAAVVDIHSQQKSQEMMELAELIMKVDSGRQELFDLVIEDLTDRLSKLEGKSHGTGEGTLD